VRLNTVCTVVVCYYIATVFDADLIFCPCVCNNGRSKKTTVRGLHCSARISTIITLDIFKKSLTIMGLNLSSKEAAVFYAYGVYSVMLVKICFLYGTTLD
jgi:hypothetical protein